MSELRANTISDAAGTGPVTLTGQYAAKAWVNFNGTGTVAIREDGNVSSLTDNGSGNYTVNFATALVDANYAAAATTTIFATGSSDLRGGIANAVRDQTTTSFRLFCLAVTGAGTIVQDVENAGVIVTR